MAGRLGKWIVAGVLLAASSGMYARDVAGFHQTVRVNAGDSLKDLACTACSIYIDGAVDGDIAVAFSDVHLGPNAVIHGDVASAFGSFEFKENNHVEGSWASFGTEVENASAVIVGGDRVSMPEPIAFLILAAPLVILAALVWGIVALVRRRRMSYPPPGYYPPQYGVPPVPPVGYTPPAPANPGSAIQKSE